MKIAIVGLGHVGLPLAVALAHAEGVERVYGIDIDTPTALKRFMAVGTLREPDLYEMTKDAAKTGRLKVVGYEYCRDVDVVIICTQTPVDDDHQLCYDALIGAVTCVGKHIMSGTLVIVESTIAPGTMEVAVVPILEDQSGLKDGVSLFVAHCPERISPGNALVSLHANPRIIGGTSWQANDLARDVYKKLGVKLHFTTAPTAEIVKTAENAYRDVQIAFANELAQICRYHDVDAWEARELINTCPGRDVHKPSIGVGGHCIPKDSWLLLTGTEMEHSVIAESRRMNDWMPTAAAQFVKSVLPDRPTVKVVILGTAYKANTSDARNSPSLVLGRRLEMGPRDITVVYHDPHVIGHQENLAWCVAGADVLILAIDHAEYAELDWALLVRRMGMHSRIFVNCCESDIDWPSEYPYYRLFSGGSNGTHIREGEVTERT